MKSLPIDQAKLGIVYLAWLGGAALPSYKLVSRRKKSWYYEGEDERLPRSRITEIWELPMPSSARRTNQESVYPSSP